MRRVPWTVVATIAACAIPTPAMAWPSIDVTAVETISLDPPRYRTTFDLTFAGYSSGYTDQVFTISALDPATLHFFEATGPPGWVCEPCFPSLPGCLIYTSLEGSGAPVPPVITASFVSDAAVPCVRFVFPDYLLSRMPSPTVHADYHVDACLLVDAPVPTAPHTWGALKAVYR